jgi:phosphatidylglycerophosphatase A
VRRLAVLIATSFGVGYIPWAPATFGSAVGVALFAFGPAGFLPRLAATGALVLLGFWSSEYGIEHFRVPDPRPVVIDEVSAQYLALLIQGPATAAGLAAGFFLFRVLDVLKPFGIRKLERLPGGIGVMTDDLAAAVAGGVALRLAARFLNLPL